ncbi:MAG: bacteriohemerythrin [Betaproteobacteria bacterium]
MALMQWSEHFVTGVEMIDTQHKKLVDLINSAAPQLAEVGEAPAREVHALLNQLADYAVFHFDCEESLMLTAGIDPGYFAHHQRSHALFAQEVTQMIQDASADSNVSGANLLRFLTNWLTFHILSEDQYMARQIRAIQSGESPEKARGTVSSENASANTVLVGALTDLFGLISQRNRTLITLNKELQLTKAGLAQANEQLEERVRERTQQLKVVNDELGREHQALSESLAQVRRTQVQLLQAEKMAAVGQLAAGVAHEINNPIGFVTSNFSTLETYSQRLFALLDAYESLISSLPVEHPAHAALVRERERAELDYLRQDIPDLLRESNEGLARVKRIVADLKDFSRVDESEWQDADLLQGLDSTLNVLSGQLKAKAEVLRDYAPLPPVRCIPAQLNQVFMSLLLNAVQAIEVTGTITLRTRVVGGNVQIAISDTGKGIPEDLQQRIFEPFFTTKSIGTGPGLGLSSSWDIVKQHAGSIEVDSRPGEGSTFTLTLPIVSPVSAGACP